MIYKSKLKAPDRPKINSSKDAAELLPRLCNENKIDFVVQFKIFLLNRANRVLGIVKVSSGGVTGTVADPKLIFIAANKGEKHFQYSFHICNFF